MTAAMRGANDGPASAASASVSASAPAPARSNIPGLLVDVSSLSRWIVDENDGDLVAAHLRLTGCVEADADFALLELAESCVEGCAFSACDFSRATFADVAFSN